MHWSHRPVLTLVALLALLAACSTPPARYEVRAAGVDPTTLGTLDAAIATGIAEVEAFFGAKFSSPFVVTVCPDRASFDASFPPEWGVTRTEPWMVATGVATDLRILSPGVWKTQASGHDQNDRVHLQGIVTHELVHVFHGQHNPTRDFTGCESIGWFIEGLAVLGSGQLDQGHRARAAEAVAARAAPAHLATAWSGPYRYGVCGSLVEFVDRRVGRQGLLRMLGATTQAELLEAAGLDEAALLRSWAASVRREQACSAITTRRSCARTAARQAPGTPAGAHVAGGGGSTV